MARIELNSIADNECGIVIADAHAGVVVERNEVCDSAGMGVWVSEDCPPSFALGAGNRLEGNRAGDVSDGRR